MTATTVCAHIACGRSIECAGPITAEIDVGAIGGDIREARRAACAEVESMARAAGWDLGDPGMPDVCPACRAAEDDWRAEVVRDVAAFIERKGHPDLAQDVRDWNWL